ncbi:hypothetical protein OJAV_G00007490 [Oryzias javanicus]|uniref:Uncharacterized protein n=1 Tax=Oryzias javanicus TaxID=123683 RepID=A0A437DN49_ORYJA|nr:hypothetical protein OJAV_G00007490 [Oryzias javanicus]
MTCVKIRYAEVLVARGKRGFAGGKQSDAALRSSLSRSRRGGSNSALRSCQHPGQQRHLIFLYMTGEVALLSSHNLRKGIWLLGTLLHCGKRREAQLDNRKKVVLHCSF